MSKRRPSGDGMVRKKDDGRWEGRIVIGHKENGDSIFRYIYAPTQKELTAKLRQEITAYQGVDLTEDSKLTLNEWMDYWLDAIMAGTIRPSTLNGYRRYADLYIKPYLGDKQISKITPTDVQKMYEVLKARGRVKEHAQYGHQLSGSMVHSIHTMFHEAMKAAKESHIIAKNPTENIPVPKANPKPKQILNDDQLEQFMEAIKHDAVWHDFFYTELTTGLRRGELCGLMWADFDEAAGTLAVRRTIHTEKGGRLVAGATKTGRGTRNILLPASTAQLLSERKKHSWSEWIFPNPLKPESPTNPRSAYGHLKALLDSAGLPNIRFHDLRHTFATHALASQDKECAGKKQERVPTKAESPERQPEESRAGTTVIRYVFWSMAGSLVPEPMQAYDWSKDTNGLREPHLPAHHPGNRPNPAEQAYRSRPSTVLPPTQAGWPPPGCGAIWLRTL